MIPVSSTLQHCKNTSPQWQQEISASFKNLSDLLHFLKLENKAHFQFTSHQQFPLRVTQFYAHLIKKNDPNDPLLLQIIPQVKESIIHPDYHSDAVGDLAAMPISGLIHKYHGRALLSLTAACGIHCRYCFRREFPYAENTPDLTPNSPIFNYLNQHQEIHEIILSGGDPLMLSDKKLQRIIQQMNQIPHLKTIRLHTRMPSILPSRINNDLLNTLAQSEKNIVMVLHINHPQEINAEVANAALKLKQAGITLLNQSVLLKNINDSMEVLETLSLALFSAHILPYYIHCLDKVQGSAHFDISRNAAIIIMKALKNRLPGYLLPKLVEETPKELSKSHIN